MSDQFHEGLAAHHARMAKKMRRIHDELRQGDPVSVTLGADHPIGDIGNSAVDARVLRAVLVADGPVAKLLREHGLDEGVFEQFGP